jgi:signal transduction histidine kinase
MNFYQKTCEKISQIGISDELSVYKKKRLMIFNRLNAFSLLVAICWFVNNVFEQNISTLFIYVSAVPFIVSLASYLLVYSRKYKVAIYLNTILIPLAISLASVQIKEGGGLFYLIVYSLFPFFYHTNIKKIIFHYLYVAALYVFSLYFIQEHFTINHFVFSPLVQVALLFFLFVILFSVKMQVLAYENILKKNKEELNQKNEALLKMMMLKDQIFTVISHDILTPLSSMRDLTVDVVKEGYSKDDLKELFPLMTDEITKAHDLFTNLLGWSKAQLEGEGKKTTNVQLLAIANKAIEQVYFQSKNKNILIINEIEEDVLANVNPDNLLVATRNLLVNAIKFSPVGGTVFVYATTNEDSCSMFVKDSGMGMTSEILRSIFKNERFTSKGTIQESGNGFGLKICKELIGQNGGTVYCENTELGKGSTFAIKMKKVIVVQNVQEKYELNESISLN